MKAQRPANTSGQVEFFFCVFFVSEITFCPRISWFEFGRHEAGQNDLLKVAMCALLLQTFSDTTRFYVSVRFVCTSLRDVPLTYAR